MNKQINVDKKRNRIACRVLGCLIFLLLNIAFAHGQYRPLDLPQSWTFKRPSVAYDPKNPEKELGDFQPGIKVAVLREMPQQPQWLVAYKRSGMPDLNALIDAPNLSETNASGYDRIAGVIADFPFLRTLLETPDPWPETAATLSQYVFGKNGVVVESYTSDQMPEILTTDNPQPMWGIQPLSATLDYSNPRDPQLIVEIWNKGDAHLSSVRPHPARKAIREKLQQIQTVFPTRMVDPVPDLSITAIKTQEDVFLLPNDLRVSLAYSSGEFLILKFQSVRRIRGRQAANDQPEDFGKRLVSRVKTNESGHRYISGISMIDQGDKGYCAAATLARVLKYYGYPIDMHAMADLAETEGKSGTRRDEIIRAMRRICQSTPFKLKELKDPTPQKLREYVEQGIPMIWFVPGHARLLIGMHPKHNEIIYSDTWGPEYQYQVGDWDYFSNNNRELWTLLYDSNN